ncbi:MAG: hypothetical protein ACHQEB_02085 [Chitinophagales bacterium]
MKKKLSAIVKGIFMTGFILFIIFPALGQREVPVISQDQIARVRDLVKPLKDQFDKLLSEDKTGNYKAYLGEIDNLNSVKNVKERSSITNNILQKYSEFFKTIWAAAKVDERSYQAKIRQIFSDVAGGRLEFQSFLSFSFSLSSIASTILKPGEPSGPNKCIDVCSMAAGQVTGDADLISGGGGDYGNCFLRINAWGAVFGKSELYGYLKNNIRIPGTFANDNRKLRVKKNYELRQQCTSFAAIGFGYAETWVHTYQSSEYLLVMSPVVYGATKINFKTMTEEYVLEKKDVALSLFKSYAGTWAYGVTGNWCYTDCASIKWGICEEQ